MVDTGLTVSATELRASLTNGSWLGDAPSAGQDDLPSLGEVSDPFKPLSQAGVEWLVEHVAPLQRALDELRGDPATVTAQAETWSAVATELATIASDLVAAVAADTTAWTGEAADNYRVRAEQTAALLTAASQGAHGASGGLRKAGELVGAVRGLVRDVIADAVDNLVKVALQIVGTGGVAAPWTIPQISQTVAATAARITALTSKLLDALRRLTPLLTQTGDLFGEATTALRTLQTATAPIPSTTLAAAVPLPPQSPGPSQAAEPSQSSGAPQTAVTADQQSGMSQPGTPGTNSDTHGGSNTDNPGAALQPGAADLDTPRTGTASLGTASLGTAEPDAFRSGASSPSTTDTTNPSAASTVPQAAAAQTAPVQAGGAMQSSVAQPWLQSADQSLEQPVPQQAVQAEATPDLTQSTGATSAWPPSPAESVWTLPPSDPPVTQVYAEAFAWPTPPADAPTATSAAETQWPPMSTQPPSPTSTGADAFAWPPGQADGMTSAVGTPVAEAGWPRAEGTTTTSSADLATAPRTDLPITTRPEVPAGVPASSASDPVGQQAAPQAAGSRQGTTHPDAAKQAQVKREEKRGELPAFDAPTLLSSSSAHSGIQPPAPPVTTTGSAASFEPAASQHPPVEPPTLRIAVSSRATTKNETTDLGASGGSPSVAPLSGESVPDVPGTDSVAASADNSASPLGGTSTAGVSEGAEPTARVSRTSLPLVEPAGESPAAALTARMSRSELQLAAEPDSGPAAVPENPAPAPSAPAGRTIAGEAASPKGAHDNPFANRPTHGDPIDVTTGWVVLPQTDVDLASTLPLLLTRTHVSHYRLGRSFGPTWACTADQRLEVDPEGVALAVEDGTLLLYPHPADNAEALPESGPRWPLVRTATGGYAVHRADRDQILHFAPGPDRERLLAAITDADGRCVQFRRDERGALVEVAHSGGYRVLVDTEDGLITAYRLAGAGTEVLLGEFRYDERRNLVAAVNSSGLPLRFEYDDLGRVARYEDRNGMWYRYAYDDEDRCTAAEGAGGYLSCRLDHAPGLTTVTDSLGNTTTYQVNERYQVVCETDPTGARTVSEWDAHHRLLSRTRPLGLRTAYRYDDRGDLVEAVLPDGSRLRTEHDGTGRPVVITDPDGAVWRREYGPNGALIAVVDPMGARTTCTYDEGGDLVEVTDASGATTHYEVNSLGLVESVTDPMGGTTRYEYDELGRRAVVIDPAGGRTRFTWTPEGGLAGRVDPDGARSVLRRDGEGNLREHTDATGAVTTIEVGPFDLPVAEVRPDGSRLEFRYDTELRPVAVVNEHGQEWRYTYDSRGHLVSEVDFDQRITTYVWDQAGRLHGHANERGESVMLDLDPRDRVVAVHTAQGRTDLAYDPVGRLLRAKGPDADLVFTYDPCGRVLSESVDGRVLESRYDVLGRRVTRRTPSGALSVWAYDLLGRPTALRAAGRTTRFSFDAAGREVERRVDDGVLVAQVWDEVDRLRSQTVVTGLRSTTPALAQRRTYGYRPDGKLVSVYDQVTGGQVLDLDEVGRVLAVRGPSGTEVYQYDRTGNVVHAHWSGSEPGAGPREHDLMRVTRAGDLAFTYDEAGRTSSRSVQRPDGGVDTWEFEWSAQDRLLSARTPNGSLWRYGYDALGRRVWKKRMADDGVTPVERVDLMWDGAAPAEQFTGAESLVWDHAPSTGHVVTQTERSRVLAGTRSLPPQGAAAQQATTGPAGAVGSAGSAQGQPNYAARLGQGSRSGEGDQVERLELRGEGDHFGQGNHPHPDQGEDPGQGSHVNRTGHADQGGRVDQSGHGGQAGRVDHGGRTEQVSRAELIGGVERSRHGEPGGRVEQQGVRAEQGVARGELGEAGGQWVDRRFLAVVTDLVGAPADLVDPDIGSILPKRPATLWGVSSGHSWTPLRFPGQHHDAETGLHYNVHRYYDPATGRYLTRDPLGLAPAANPWTYADNPTAAVDPVGLVPCSPLSGRAVSGYLSGWAPPVGRFGAASPERLLPSASTPFPQRGYGVGEVGRTHPAHAELGPWHSRAGNSRAGNSRVGQSVTGRSWAGIPGASTPGMGEPSVVAAPMAGTCGSRLQELADRHQRDLYGDATSSGNHRSGDER
ncbi:hypothetical protein KCV87_05675 [Actinosynnema pretiosum subsp. pretiosum]|uniref:Rhs protein n=1 Tax=Actinosynnema pretiosum subsp. pretiosum TaxID=103721 RepID=A0AA45L919_9PSEU|nr:hypothetical protein KCV87_05675 [Actinosynnema pretiosum subsp. pretiosum]